MSPPPDIDALSPTELKSLVLKLLEEQAEFRRTIGALRDEIARMKGGPGRPDIKANVMPLGLTFALTSGHQGERQAERHGKGERGATVGPVWRAPAARRHAREAHHSRGADARGRSAARLAFQRLRELPGAGSDDPPACHRLPPGMLADPGRHDGDGSLAGGRRWTFRT